jgi:hypothetical protein
VGIRVAWGRCTDAESPAYWPWRQLLRALRGTTSLDREARDAYRKRLAELEDDLRHAEDNADLGQAAALRAERDFIAAELAAAFGLGGRERLAGDRHERARKAVAMRIRTALRSIREVHPALGRHLQASVATGRFCVYRPEQSVKWQV